jgi:penicillin-binding protein 1C
MARRANRAILLARRQRRRQPNHAPLIRIGLAVLSGLFIVSFFLVTVPAALAGVGYLYLREETPPWVDEIVEDTVGASVAFYAENFYEGELPPPESVEQGTERAFKTTKIYDRTGQHLLWEVYDPRGGNRQVVPLEQIPLHLRQATIALEDKTFYENPGVDVRGITRAALLNFEAGTIVGGGSSITQQLIKNVAIDPEERSQQSYERKIKEVILSIQLSQQYDKDTILEWYLNTINYGRRAYGVQAAAATYFGKDVSQLTVAESAMLAMLPNLPAVYDPFTEPEAAVERQRIVLGRMLEEGYLSEEEYEAALEEPVLDNLVRPTASEYKAPHFTIYVQRLLEEKFGTELLYSGGLTVYTTLDYEVFQQQEQFAREHIAAMQAEGVDATNAAVVTINPRTGEIVSMVGSLDYNNAEIDGEINMALAPRQPGSSVKPYTFLAAFMNGYTPASLIWDVRTVFGDYPNEPYVPENYYRTYNGPVLLRSALGQSLNIPAVKLMDQVGKEQVVNLMHRMGINTLNADEVGLSLTLGGGEVTLLDHTFAFSVLANNGVMAGEPVPDLQVRPGYRELDPVAILRVDDALGNMLYSYTEPQAREIVSPQYAYLMQNILSDNEARLPAFAEDNPLRLPDRPAAAKTGTTNDFRDGWTLGFTPQYVTGVWVGNADYHDMGQEAPGGSVAAPIWQRSMMALHEGLPAEPFPVPPGMVQAEICKTSGMLPTPNCPETRTEIFIEGTQPTTPDTLHQAFRICGDSGRLATIYCPESEVREQVFMMVPPEAEDWARQNDMPLPPVAYDASYGPAVGGGPISIERPAAYGYVRDITPIEGSAFVSSIRAQTFITSTDNPTGTWTSNEVSNFRLYRVQFGQGLDPSSWIQIGPDHYETRRNQNLEFWDTRGFADGLYTLQLIVLSRNGNQQVATVQATIDNTPPTVEITYPYADTDYELGGDSWLNVQANATDNITLDRVEFYVNGQLFNTARSTYNVRWTMEDAQPPIPEGEERELELYAVAYDAAGNRTESERIRVLVRHRE